MFAAGLGEERRRGGRSGRRRGGKKGEEAGEEGKGAAYLEPLRVIFAKPGAARLHFASPPPP